MGRWTRGLPGVQKQSRACGHLLPSSSVGKAGLSSKKLGSSQISRWKTMTPHLTPYTEVNKF